MIDERVKLGNRKLRPLGWHNGYTKPGGRFWKRQASKRARRSVVHDGSYSRKVFGWFEWC